MTKLLERQIGKLMDMCLKLGRTVEENVRSAMKAVKERNVELARDVIKRDELIDLGEVDLEEECLKVLALYQPVAIDLRTIIAVLKITNDLERIGDLAVNISERAIFASKDGDSLPRKIPLEIDPMADIALSMLRGALDSLMEMDVRKAHEVYRTDEEVDALHLANFNRLEEAIRDDPGSALALTRYLSVSRFIERMADHATNIAEDVIYLLDGEIVRHRLNDSSSK